MSTTESFHLLAIDPGTIKCGLAVLDSAGKVLLREISPTDTIQNRLAELIQRWNVSRIVYGQSTGAKNIQLLLEELQQRNESTFTVHSVDEKNSTLEARPLYWQEYPRRGLLRLLPISLLAPPVAIDDFAAVVLGRRFLESL
jgi:RNase H-fold protein (predicted Holliday junction resolvase)